MENTLGTPPLARSHYPKRQDGHEPITYPTNPEVAVCQVPVFGLRFVVGILKVYIEHVCSIFSGVRPLFLGQEYEGAPQHVTVRLHTVTFLTR